MSNLGIQVFSAQGSRLIKWCQAFFALKNYQVIHCHSPYPLKFLLPVFPFLLLKKIIYTRHGADPLAGKSWFLVHKLAKFFVDEVSFVSQEGADVFQKSHGWHSKTKHVIDNGVNLSEVKVLREGSKQFRLGSVGRMVPLKNQVCLLDALSLLPNEKKVNVEIHFFGDGPSMNDLSDFVLQNGLDQYVVFHGMVSDRSAIYNSFDTLSCNFRNGRFIFSYY